MKKQILGLKKDMQQAQNNKIKLISTNKKAFHDYVVVESLECGINLVGCEVKSLRRGEVNLADSYCRIVNGNLVLIGCHIKNYDKGSYSNVESRRDRRLLANRREINRMLGKVKEKGYSIVPLKLYFKSSLVKVEVALVKGKRDYDKKETLLKKDAERDLQRTLKEISNRK